MSGRIIPGPFQVEQGSRPACPLRACDNLSIPFSVTDRIQLSRMPGRARSAPAARRGDLLLSTTEKTVLHDSRVTARLRVRMTRSPARP